MADIMNEAFNKDTGLPGTALPSGQGYIQRPNQMIDVPQGGGRTDTYYPTTSGGQLDLFSKTAMVENAPPEESAYDNLNVRKKVYDIESLRKYHEDMAEAVIDPTKPATDPTNLDQGLAQMAYQGLALNKAKVDAWYEGVQHRFSQIDKDATATRKERNQALMSQLDKEKDPIYVEPVLKQAKRQSPMSPLEKDKLLGQLSYDLFSPSSANQPITREDALLLAGKMFGANFEKTVPEAIALIDQKFKPKATPVVTKKNPPVGYPDAVWSNEHKMWTIVRNGKLMGVK